MTRLISIVLVLASALFLGPSLSGREHEVVPLFGLTAPADGPFPSDLFTVTDDTQNTGRRVSLRKPDCTERVSDCQDLDVINELDGFNLQPRLSIPFSGGINPDTVTSDSVFLVSLGSTLQDHDGMPWGSRVGINQVVWDPSTETLHVESDALLDQHTRYVLVVTKRLREENDKAIKAAKEFLNFIDDDVTESTGDPDRDAYRADLRHALTEVDTRGIVPKGQIVAASVFTTRSATAVLEKIHDQIHRATPDPADFLLGRVGARTVFRLDEIASMQWNQQTRDNPPGFTARTLDLSAIRTFPGAIDSIGFGIYRSPDYAVHPGEYIPPVATRTGEPEATRINEIYFNVFLPSGPMPPNGWPVAIVGHGINGSKNPGFFPLTAPAGRSRDEHLSALAAQGIAIVTTNAVGAGFGPLGTLTVNTTAGASVTFSAGGRGIDQGPSDGRIGPNEGGVPVAPRAVVHYSDLFRQTAVDLMQLVRVIEVGVDVDGDGQRDLDPSRIYYRGGSWSGGYGTVFLGVEPDVRAATISAPADPVWFALLGGERGAAGAVVAARQPSLINFPGIQIFAEVPVAFPFFDENWPLRNGIPLTVQLEGGARREIKSPVTNNVTGAMALQEMIERYEWVSQSGSPVAYAPHIRKAPLGGAPPKTVLYVVFKGDQTAPNPTTTAILRAGVLKDRTMYYRHDLARLDNPSIPQNPHGFNIATIAPDFLQLEATFFATNGATIVIPRYFEFPIDPLPEDLNFIK
jgi:hypothetical protein